MTLVETWDELEEADALQVLMSCCGSRRWALGVIGERPLCDVEHLIVAARAQWERLEPTEWIELFRSHDRLAEPNRGTLSDSSVQEQSLIYRAGTEQRELLRTASAAYEQRFGFPFITFAHGRSPADIQDELGQRISHSRQVELDVAAAQHRLIAERRLQLAFREATTMPAQ